MNKKTYEALKRILAYFKDLPLEICGDIKQVEDWLDEVAKEYKEEPSIITNANGDREWL